tara:strand:- start:10430 stop:12037 length:1608 start_codon:yes stop_codon:yes gene_type:complete
MKIIKDFKINLSDMSAAKQTRNFTITGDENAIFSLEITNEDATPTYYNFDTKTFSTTKARLNRRRLVDGSYSDSITFPAIGDNDQYDIKLFAENGYDTFHSEYKEVKFADGSLDINSSTGSNSSLLKKVIYQYTDTTITLSAVSPNSVATFGSMAITGNNTIVASRGQKITSIPFSIIVTAAAARAFQIIQQPTSNDITSKVTRAIGANPVNIIGEDIYPAVSDTDTVNGAVTSGITVTMDNAVASNVVVGDRITGNTALNGKVVTVVALTGTYTFTMSEAIAIADGITLSFSNRMNHRWSLTSNGIFGLATKMKPIGTNITTNTIISPYKDITQYTTVIEDEYGALLDRANTVINASSPALDTVSQKPTITNGVVTHQLGDVTFNKQQKLVLGGDSVVFYAYGLNEIETMLNTKIELTNLSIALTKPTTTTTEATSAHATIAVADREGVINNVSQVSGIGINPLVADPFLTTGGGLDGAGDWVMDATQTLENGITLTVENTSRVATITGNISVTSVNNSNFTLEFDLEKLLEGN